jgi:integrase
LGALRQAAFAQVSLKDVKASHIRTWSATRLSEVSAATVKRELVLLSGVFSYAAKDWEMAWLTNPCRQVRWPTEPPARRQRWSDADIEAVAAFCGYRAERTPTTLKELVPHVLKLAVASAMRLGEIFSIQVEDIDAEACCVTLAESKNGDANVRVPLSKAALAHLHILAGKRRHGPLIHYTADSFSTVFREVRKELGLSHLRFHDARREAATRMSAKLSNVLELSAVTRHKSLRYLQVYYAPTPASIAAKLDVES